VTATGSATYGDASAAEGFNATGFVLGEDASVLGGTALYTTSYTQGDPAGTSETVDVSGLMASNYAISYVESTFTVGQAALTVTATGSATYGDASATEGFQATGFVLGEDASVLGGTALYTTSYVPGDAAGTSETVDVSGLTASNYAISYVEGTFTVAKKGLTVTASGSATYGDASATEGFTATGFVLGQNASVLGGTALYTTSYAPGDAAGTNETVDVSGLTSSNYAIGYVEGTFTVAKKGLTVTATGSATYGDASATEGFNATGFVFGEDASVLGGTALYTTSYVPGDAAGTSETVDVSGLTASNYAISYVEGTFTVAKKGLTVTASGSATYGDASATEGFSAGGFVLGQNASVLGGTAVYTTSYKQGDAAGTSETVDVSGLMASNYAISYIEGTFSVAKKGLTVTATGSATYGDASATEGFNAMGFVLGQNASVLGGTAVYTTSYKQGDAAGTSETVDVSGLTSSNYAISYIEGTFTVAQATVITVPTTVQTAYENVNQAIGGISISSGLGGNSVLTLGVSHGKLTVGTTSGLTITGNGTGALKLVGTTANLNAALASLVYRGNLNYFGSDTLSVGLSNNGISFSAGVAINVVSIAQQDASLVAQVKALQQASVLTAKQANVLLGDLALQGNRGDVGKMRSFINEVKSYVSSHTLSKAQANALLGPANILLQGLEVEFGG
jgi:sulfur carrier protein ThiS